MELTIYSAENAPDESKAILDGISSDLGFVPNMAGTAAGSAALLSAFDGLRRAVGSGQLDPIAREVAGVAVGVAVDNQYGVAFHSTVLASLGVDDTEIERMRAGKSPTDGKFAAVYEILEVVAECTFAGLVGTLDNLAGRVELDEFLRPRAWS
jgi:hypothetical protein